MGRELGGEGVLDMVPGGDRFFVSEKMVIIQSHRAGRKGSSRTIRAHLGYRDDLAPGVHPIFTTRTL